MNILQKKWIKNAAIEFQSLNILNNAVVILTASGQTTNEKKRCFYA